MNLPNQNNPMTRKERTLRGLRYFLGVYAAMVVPVLVCWLWTAGPIERHQPYHSIDQWYRLCFPVALLAWGVACFPRRRRWHRVAAGIFVVVAIAACGVLAGSLPAKQMRILSAWLAIHEDELYAAWNRAVRGEAPGKIQPLA